MLPSCGDSGDGEGNGNGKEDWQNKTFCGWIKQSVDEMLSWFHISHISGNLLATCHALTGSNRQRTTGLPLPVVANKRPWQWAAFDTASALREDTTPTERVWCFNVWYLPTTFLLLKRVKVSEFFAVRCGFQICVLPPSLAPQNIWIDVFQQKWSVHMSQFEFC